MFHRKKKRKEFDEFEEFEKRMFQVMNELLFNMPDFDELMRNSKPLAVGFTIKFDAKGVPSVRVKRYEKRRNYAKRFRTRSEPLYEVRYDRDSVWIVAALPGAREENIKLEVQPNLVRIFATEKDTSYYKEIPLEERVKPESLKKSFNNGILELIIEKESSKADSC